MAKPLKTAGMQELAAFKRRLVRQLAMRRVSSTDCDFIMKRLEEIEARVVSMNEEGGDDAWL